MRWGLIGTGRHANEKIVPALVNHPTERLHGVVAREFDKAAEFAERHGCRPYSSLDAMLTDPMIEAVFICTPNDLHRVQTEAAAAAGKHVLVEKPMALTGPDCQAMIDGCRAARVKLGVGFQQRYHPAHKALREIIASGVLGDIVIARGEWHTAYGPWSNWRAKRLRAGADVIAAVGVHVFDLLSFALGADVDETASLIDISTETGLDQTAVVALRWVNGAMGAVTITRRARAHQNNIYLLGTKGSAIGIGTLGMNPSGTLEITVDGHSDVQIFAVPDLYAEQFTAFGRAVKLDLEPSASGLDGLRSAMLTERLVRTTLHDK